MAEQLPCRWPDSRRLDLRPRFRDSSRAFVDSKKWELYGRTSLVFGQFRNSYEYAPGVKWYPLRNRRVYIVGEGLRIFNSPAASIITPYNSGFKGWSPMLQWMFNF
jgi:hypothetical protein